MTTPIQPDAQQSNVKALAQAAVTMGKITVAAAPALAYTALINGVLGWLGSYALRHGFHVHTGWIGIAVGLWTAAMLGKSLAEQFGRSVAVGFHAGTDTHNTRKSMAAYQAAMSNFFNTTEQAANGGNSGGAYL